MLSRRLRLPTSFAFVTLGAFSISDAGCGSALAPDGGFDATTDTGADSADTLLDMAVADSVLDTAVADVALDAEAASDGSIDVPLDVAANCMLACEPLEAHPSTVCVPPPPGTVATVCVPGADADVSVAFCLYDPLVASAAGPCCCESVA